MLSMPESWLLFEAESLVVFLALLLLLVLLLSEAEPVEDVEQADASFEEDVEDSLVEDEEVAVLVL